LGDAAGNVFLSGALQIPLGDGLRDATGDALRWANKCMVYLHCDLYGRYSNFRCMYTSSISVYVAYKF
jgi:hypothetical protein